MLGNIGSLLWVSDHYRMSIHINAILFNSKGTTKQTTMSRAYSTSPWPPLRMVTGHGPTTTVGEEISGWLPTPLPFLGLNLGPKRQSSGELFICTL